MRLLEVILILASALLAARATVTNSEDALLQIFPDIKTNLVLRPTGGKDENATVVSVSIYVLDIHSINDDDQTISLSLYIRQRWTDPRLKFSSSNPDVSDVVLNDRSKLWTPDTFIVNERKTKFSDALVENSFIRISSDGQVVYSTRLHTTLSCNLNHYNFPFDKQTCELSLESYGHTAKTLVYQWYRGDVEHPVQPVDVAYGLTTGQFVLEGYGVKGLSIKLKNAGAVNEYSRLWVDFLLARHSFGRYFMQVYLPTGVALLLAYLSLYLWVEWSSKVYAAGVGVAATTLIAAYASSLNPSSASCTALTAWGFWSVILSTLPLLTLLSSRLFSPVPQNEGEVEKRPVAQPKVMPRIEKVALFMIPLVFVLFNFVYWANFASRVSVENSLNNSDEKYIY